MIEKLIEAARQHGLKSEPDHEVGDLQDILRTCWQYISKRDREKVFAEHRQKIKDWLSPHREGTEK